MSLVDTLRNGVGVLYRVLQFVRVFAQFVGLGATIGLDLYPSLVCHNFPSASLIFPPITVTAQSKT
jgi:hypothetical protein